MLEKRNLDQNEEFDWDQYEKKAQHLVLIDKARLVAGRHDYVVGTCRMIIGDFKVGPQQFYSNSEFILDNLLCSSKHFLEVGELVLILNTELVRHFFYCGKN